MTEKDKDKRRGREGLEELRKRRTGEEEKDRTKK